MEFDMRAKIFLCAWIIGLFLFHRTAHAQPTPERINAIYASIAGDHAALYVAQEMGLFRKYGSDVNLCQRNSDRTFLGLKLLWCYFDVVTRF